MAIEGKYMRYSMAGSKEIGITEDVGDRTSGGKIKAAASQRDQRRLYTAMAM